MRGKYERRRLARAAREQFADIGGTPVKAQRAEITDIPPSSGFDLDQRNHEPLRAPAPVAPSSTTKTCASCKRTGMRGFEEVGGRFFCTSKTACRNRAAKL